MGTITINGKKVEFTDEKNVLTIIRKAGFEVPTLCYQPELSIFGACRLCMVEDDRGRFFASCSEEPRDGMVIYTHTERLRKNRKLIVELLLAAHCRDCTTCDKHGRCKLQKLAYQLGINNVRFENHREIQPVDFSSPAIVRDPNKCILCGCCVRACSELQGIGVLAFAHRGTDATVTTAFDRKMAMTNCVSCGQCRVVCPTGALTIHHNMTDVWQALGDKNTRVVAQIAPAVRVAIGEAFGLPKGENSMGKVVAALHRMGFDEVFDTAYTADLTIMEESAEFLERVKAGTNLPLMTSCCPAWVKYVENERPEFLKNLSTARSPMQMFASVLKENYRKKDAEDGRTTFHIAIMPCTAKKMEAKRPEFQHDGKPDVDLVLTTQEIIMMIKESGIRFAELEGESPDLPFGMGTGAATIFGTTGGVAEAVARRVVEDKSKNTLQAIQFSGIRGSETIRAVTLPVGDRALRIAVVHGLVNAQKLLDDIESGQEYFDLVEVMTCKTGCVGGAGQPYGLIPVKQQRAEGLYEADRTALIKRSERNPIVTKLLEGAMKGRTHQLLHVEYKRPDKA